jgi:hypothetical protein
MNKKVSALQKSSSNITTSIAENPMLEAQRIVLHNFQTKMRLLT